MPQIEIDTLTDRLSGVFAKMTNKPVEPVSEYERLKSFLSAVRPHLRQAEVSKAPAFAAHPDSLKEALDELRPALAEARRDGILINPWTMAGLKRNEVRNSAALAGLWSPSHGGDTAVKFLASFLGRLKPVGGKPLPDAVQLKEFGYSIRVEDCPLGDRTERVDLVIENQNFIIGIEVKIDAPEGKIQLERYKKSLEQRGRNTGRDVFLIYLAPARLATNILVIRANWGDVVNSALETIPKKSDRSFNHHLIANFAAHISNF